MKSNSIQSKSPTNPKNCVSLRRNNRHEQQDNLNNMSEATLSNLLEYLYGTLTPSNMLWMAERLTEHAKHEEEAVKPYTMEEINARIDQSERDFAEGNFYTHEEVLKMLDEELELTPEYAEAV